MAYKTLIANSSVQKRWSYESNATTLAELKQEFKDREIPYEGLSITEGLCTKAELTRDDALLPSSPRTVTYGGETYSRVFLITNTHKNIASGCMSRKEAYEYIKQMGKEAQEEIKRLYGRNYTQVSTENLVNYVMEFSEEETAETPAPEQVETPQPVAPVKTAPHTSTVEWFYDGIKKLTKDNALFAADIEVLIDLLTELMNIMKVTHSQELTDDDLDILMATL